MKKLKVEYLQHYVSIVVKRSWKSSKYIEPAGELVSSSS
jgi:hypothetical protein